MIGIGLSLGFRRALKIGDAAPAPMISLPPGGALLTENSPVSVEGTVTPGKNPVASVSVYLGPPAVGGVLLGVATGTTAWTYNFTPTAGQVGNRVLFALALDSLGNSGVSTGVSVSIQLSAAAQYPTSYSGLLGWWGPQGTAYPNTLDVATRSNALTVNYAALSNTTVTAGQPDHLGGTSGFKIAENTLATAQRYIRTTGTGDTGTFQAGDISVEFYAKQNVGTRGIAQALGPTNLAVIVNLDTRVATKSATLVSEYATADAGNGWTRVNSVMTYASVQNQHIGLSGDGGLSINAYTNGELGSVYVSFGPAGHCSQTRAVHVADASGASRDAVRDVGSEALQPFIWTSPQGTGKWLGTLCTVTKSLALPVGVYSGLQGSWTIGMRASIVSVAAGTIAIFDMVSTTPKLKIERNATSLNVTRTQDNGTTLTASAITGLTTGIHDIWLWFDQPTGTVTGYLDGVPQTPVTVTTGTCTFSTMVLQFNQFLISDLAIFSEAKNSTEIENMRLGMSDRKGVLP